MSFPVDIVVTSNVQKDVPPGVELVVGMPSSDPWSLPFAHKKVLAERVDKYDLFIYCEDDTLATERNIEAFLEVTRTLNPNEIAGYLRYEDLPDGTINYCDVNGHYHWDPNSVVKRGQYTLAFHSNEHAAFYLLTREQLRRCLDSGGFLVAPHRGKYDLACTSATDPYTQCGFRKLVCISHLERFLLHHLPNKYVGTKFGTHASLMQRQIDSLMGRSGSDCPPWTLFTAQTKLQDAWYSKDYYEPARPEILSRIPPDARTVLSVGTGSGETERWLVASGKQVTAMPIDSVIANCARSDGVEIIAGDFPAALNQLADRQFDALYLSNVLHLVPDPEDWLKSLSMHLRLGGIFIAVFPNVAHLKNRIGKFKRIPAFRDIGDYEKCGVHLVSARIAKRWCSRASIRTQNMAFFLSPKLQRFSVISLGTADPFISSEFALIGRRTKN